MSYYEEIRLYSLYNESDSHLSLLYYRVGDLLCPIRVYRKINEGKVASDSRMPISTAIIKRHLCPPKVQRPHLSLSSINWWFANTPLKGSVTGQLRIEDGTVSSKENP